MFEKPAELKKLFEEKLAGVTATADIEQLRIEFLGKKGSVAALMQELRNIPNDQKKEAGQAINDVKQFVENAIAEKLEELRKLEEQKLIDACESYDESMPTDNDIGSYHPITLVRREVENIFLSMGFSIEDYSEITDDYNCFEALNIPKHHPARDMQDTYYLSTGQLLKTHTSAAQNTILRKYKASLENGGNDLCRGNNKAVSNVVTVKIVCLFKVVHIKHQNGEVLYRVVFYVVIKVAYPYLI